MAASTPLDFAQADLLRHLVALDDDGLDGLGFGVIAFGKEPNALVSRYNRFEQQGAGLDRGRVVGQPLFTVVAQCMNNYLVAQRFDDAVAAGRALDETLDYTFTWRMRATPVVLRLLSAPEHALQYIAVRRER